jgi:hypothetical protein
MYAKSNVAERRSRIFLVELWWRCGYGSGFVYNVLLKKTTSSERVVTYFLVGFIRGWSCIIISKGA